MSRPDVPELVGIGYSAWTQKARWALDAHEVSYRYREYLPMLGEPGLRLRLGTPLRKVSVPVLFTEVGPFTDSWDIAQWAAANANNDACLIDDQRRADIAEWNTLSDTMLAAGRARTTRRVLTDREALLESVPPPMNQLGPLTGAIGASGARFLLWKYGAGAEDEEAAVATMRGGLTRLRAALGDGGFVLDRFTYADVAMAVTMMFIAPPPDDLVRIGPKARPHWNCPELAAEFPELVEWSHGVYAQRPPSMRAR